MALIKIDQNDKGIEISIQGTIPELLNALANGVERSEVLSVVVIAVAKIITDRNILSAANAALDMCMNEEADPEGVGNLSLILSNSRKNNPTNE